MWVYPKYNAADDLGATGIYGKCTVKGAFVDLKQLKPGYLLFKGVDLVRADDAVYDLLVKLNVVNGYDRAERYDAGIDLCLVNDNCISDELLKLADSRLSLCLLVSCFIVLGVLGKVTEGSRGGDLLLVFLNSYVYEKVELVLKSLEARRGVDFPLR